MKKKIFYTEIAYLCGTLLIALGTALNARAEFGISMVVAPAYVIYHKLAEIFPFVTFGMTEYTFQALLIVVMCLVLRRFRWTYLFAFLNAVLYGLSLDLFTLIFDRIGIPSYFAVRLILYVLGVTVVALGVAFMFSTYISPGIYELFVKEFSRTKRKPLDRVKTVYDLSSLAVAVILCFLFFGKLRLDLVGIGTVICALVNGTLISLFGKMLDHFFVFRDALPYRKYFEN